MNILGICGSLRAASFNKYLLETVTSMLPDGVKMQVFDLGGLPLYNQDLETGELPAAVTAFKAAIDGSDALLIATPEYNFGVTGVLKNAIDWASRPTYKSPLANKPAGILSASPSSAGGARSQSQLKLVLSGTLTPVYPAPEFQIAAAHGAFDETGLLTDQDSVRRLKRFVDGFVAWSGGLAGQEK